MAHEVFISYASADRVAAEQVAVALEAASTACWMAPRDVAAGTDFAEQIVAAIRGARVVVLVFSTAANASVHVKRELDRAVSAGVALLPLRLEAIEPSGALEYYLAGSQWLDAFEHPLGSHLASLRAAVGGLLEAPSGGRTGRVDRRARSQDGKSVARAAPVRIHEGERRLVTVLVVRISGLSTLAEKLDPEVRHDLIAGCFDRLSPCVERYGGTVDRFVGDEAVAFFGAPLAHEDDAERALHAALVSRRVLTRFNEERRAGFTVCCGVDTGLVYAGNPGGGSHKDYSIMGAATEAAMRLAKHAKSGEILVGHDAHRQAESRFEWQTMETLRVKGESHPVTTYRLVGARVTGRRPQTSGLTSPMVGRQEEFALLSSALDRLARGRGGLCLIAGEAGIGKSRLLEEMRAEAQRRGCSWLEGRTLSFGRTISYWPFLEIVQQDAGINSEDAEAERWVKLAGRVTELFGEEAPEVLPYLASLLGYPVPEELAQWVRHLDSEAMGRHLYRASRLYFARLAQVRPLVVVFEDVHWLDGSSAALLEHLLPLVADVPLLICCAARPEADSALGRLRTLARGDHAERATEIVLHPLSSEESTELACNLVRLEELPSDLRSAILDKAEGNPFFVEEIVRSLIDFGGLVRDDAGGSYRVTEQAAHFSIPDTLTGVIMARVDRLDDDLKQVLRLASVVGRSFFYRVLATVSEAERELDKELAGLQACELVLEKAHDPELEYIFKHALVQEATYESILLQRRRDLHRKVAAAIETLYSDRLEDFCSLLAYHHTKAEDWQKAQEYLFKAGDQAGKIAADGEALDHYEQAMEIYARAFGDRWDPLERAAIEHKMGAALYRRGEHERAREYLFRALADLEDPFPVSATGVHRAIAYQLLRQLGHRLFPRLFRRSASPRRERVVEEEVWIYYSLIWMDTGENHTRLLLSLLLALNTAEAVGLHWSSAASLNALGYAFDLIPLPRLARYYHRLGLTLSEKAQEPFTLATAHLSMGLHEYWATGEWSIAFDYLYRARDEFRTLGRVRDWGAATTELIDMIVDQGDLSESLLLSREVVAFADETGDHVARGWGEIRVGVILSIRGVLDEAEENLRTGVGALMTMQPADAVMGAGWLALCLLKQGRADEARAILSEHEQRILKYGISGYCLRGFATAQAMLFLQAAEHTRDSASESALKEAKTACSTLRKVAKADICAFIPADRLQGTHEWFRGRPKKAETWWRKSLEMADRLGARYEGALTRLELGRRLRDRTAVEQAAATFRTIGAQFDLAQAQGLLDEMGEDTVAVAAARGWRRRFSRDAVR